MLVFFLIVSPLHSQDQVCKHQGHQGIPPFLPMSTHSHFDFIVSSTSQGQQQRVGLSQQIALSVPHRLSSYHLCFVSILVPVFICLLG